MLVHTGGMQMLADRSELSSLSARVKAFVESESVGGFVSKSRASVGHPEYLPRRHAGRKPRMSGASVHMELEVPSRTFSNVMAFLRTLAAGEDDLVAENEGTTDVTEQFVDQKARADSLEGTHKAMLALLGRAKSVKDVLSVQRELHQIVQQLEARKATLKSLQSRADFARISLSLTQRDLPPLDDDSGGSGGDIAFSWNPARAVKRAIRVLVRITEYGLDALVYFIFIAVPLATVCSIGRWLLCCLTVT